MQPRSPETGLPVDGNLSDGRRLAGYTTLGLGGPARRLVVATTEAETIDAVRGADGPVLVLGGGSNVVVDDAGFAGTVVLVRVRGVAEARTGDRVTLTVAAGEPWDDVCGHAAAAGLAGVECLSGVPGSAGATPIQNVGAYGQEVAETIVAVRVYDRHRDETRSMLSTECGFSYRTSVFKRDDRYVVLAVDFSLAVSPRSAPIRYAELARTLGVSVGERAPLADVRSAVLHLRAGKGMVLDPDDADTRSVGSFFTNPVLDPGAYARLRECLVATGLTGAPPAWPAADGGVKVSAAWLIERAGFTKGYGHSGSGVALSGKHTLALTNRGDGSTGALLALAREIRDGVATRFGVTLRPEPVLVGCAL